MQQKQTFEGYRGLYLERSGESAAQLVETLMQEPEMPLNDQDKQYAYDFEKSLADYKLNDGTTIEQMVRSAKGEDSTAPFIFPEYIHNGSVDLSSLNIPPFQSHEEVYIWFAKAVHEKQLPVSELLKIAKQTSDCYKKTIEGALINDESVPPRMMEYRSMVINPDQVLVLGAQAIEARQAMLKLRTEHRMGPGLDGAKRAIIDVYLARINSIIADQIPVADYLVRQSNDIGDHETAEAAEQTIPPSLAQALRKPELRTDVFLRLDYLRNGIGINDVGEPSAVTAAVVRAARHDTLQTSDEAVFSHNEAEILRNTELSPEEIQHIFSRIIERAGLLSGEDPSTWNPDRRVRAGDGKFQVVINPSKNTFEVSGIDGTFRVPPISDSLYRVLTVGGFHELQHISQSMADQQMGNTLRIGGAMKGKRPSMIREGGANAAQRTAELALFGEAKPITLTYALALEALRDGGSLLDASHAFFDIKRRAMPDISPQKAAKEASDRVLRLIRRGGYNSQAMSYAEEGILADELRDSSSQARVRAMAVTSLDLVDQVRLHRYGLLPSKMPTMPDWTALVLEELAPYIDEALSNR